MYSLCTTSTSMSSTSQLKSHFTIFCLTHKTISSTHKINFVLVNFLFPLRVDDEKSARPGGHSDVTPHVILQRRTEVDVAVLLRSRSDAHTLFTPDIHSSPESKGCRIIQEMAKEAERGIKKWTKQKVLCFYLCA